MSLAIHLWSGPRNVSTALMYSFAQRTDTRVVDEPLYGHYLRVHPVDHPGQAETLAVQGPAPQVIRDVFGATYDRPIVFYKQMAHHLIEVDRSFFAGARHVLLIRHPAEVINSYIKVMPQPDLTDIGIAMQTALFDELVAGGHAPLVLDGTDLLQDPPRILRALCAGLDIPFDPQMLSWPAGPRPEDGPWAPWWYTHLHRSTGFAPYSPKSREVPPAQAALLAAALPHYERLRAVVIR